MDYKEFKNMLLLINKDLKDNEVELAFCKFDVNGDKVITFAEFKDLLYKISGKPRIDDKFKKELEKALQSL